MDKTNGDAERVRAAAEALWQLRLEHPFWRHTAGLLVESIPAGSLAEAQQDVVRVATIAATLQGVREEELVETDRLTLAYLRHALAQGRQAETAWLWTSPVAPYSGYLPGYYAQFILGAIRIDSEAAFERWSSLWSDLGALLREVVVRVHAQAALGRRLARPALEPTLNNWRHLRSQFTAMLSAGSASAPQVAESMRSRWADSAERLREREVLPAVESVIALLADPAYAVAAPAAAGLMHQPGGDDEYRRLIANHLTVADDPERIHRLGLAEVAQLAERMREVRSGLGFDGPEGEFHARLKRDPRVVATTPEDVAERYERCMRRLDPLLTRWFARLPRSPYAVQRLAPEQEAGMTFGYYDKPSRIGEPGTYRFNASNLHERSQLGVAPLIYHELAPGHHLHMARQMELEQLPPVRRNALELTAFNEGWAEYASGLAGEMGLYDDPYDLYGHLVHERFVAQRLVVDTGLNALGWTLGEARDFMRDNTLEGDALVASETLRYATDLPAQALTYRLGYRWFMDLREETRARLGARFDVREFHEAVLGEGALPLAALREHVQRVVI